MGFSRQEYWSGLPFPSPVDLPNPGIEPRSPTLQGDALTLEPPEKPGHHNLTPGDRFAPALLCHHMCHWIISLYISLSWSGFLDKFFFLFIYLLLFFHFRIFFWFCHTSTCIPHPEAPSHLPPHTIPKLFSIASWTSISLISFLPCVHCPSCVITVNESFFTPVGPDLEVPFSSPSFVLYSFTCCHSALFISCCYCC